MGIELSRMIAEVVAAAGRGAESLRQTGTPVVLEECSIEIVLGEVECGLFLADQHALALPFDESVGGCSDAGNP